MKTAIITDIVFNYDWSTRIKYIEQSLEKQGYKVLCVTADFNHRTKTVYSNPGKDNLCLLHVPSYQKNLSLRRMWSHFIFARQLYTFCQEQKPNLIYAVTPPNFIFKYLSLYKKYHTHTTLIYEIKDMWPESLPIANWIKKLACIPMAIWSYIRNRYVVAADAIVFECSLFQEALNKQVVALPDIQYLIYLTREDQKPKLPTASMQKDILRFLYLGSVNNLIDIPFIVDILKQAQTLRPVELHLIGGGEKESYLRDLCNENNIPYICHGLVYEHNKKEEIMSQCHFALNIMKDTVFVGATMKSLEYFHYGLPIINNIRGDSWKLIEESKCGANVTKENIDQVMEHLCWLPQPELDAMKQKSRDIFQTLFTPVRTKYTLNNLFSSLAQRGIL